MDESPRRGRGQVHQITPEVTQDKEDVAVFEVDGKDKSWFLQKGGLLFDCGDAPGFRMDVSFLGGATSCFGDDYAELSRAGQHATINWMLMVGAARSDVQLTGYKDCKTSGFYFLLHLNYRRTHWRVICCPHNAELEDSKGEFHTCNPQDGDQFEFESHEGQTLGVELAGRELWLLDGGARIARGHWVHGDSDVEGGRLPVGKYRPAVLTPNCPTRFRAAVAGQG
mmetsp:Transcript_56020/g.156085  ORF Transcript_56020/g.156085 Transcript_56020/m.156085 type:complete len:225 (-) Transcript_56020:63-737(-)